MIFGNKLIPTREKLTRQHSTVKTFVGQNYSWIPEQIKTSFSGHPAKQGTKISNLRKMKIKELEI